MPAVTRDQESEGVSEKMDRETKPLEALETGTIGQPVSPHGKAKWFRIRVTDLKTNTAKVTVNLPMSIVDWGLRAGSKIPAFGGTDLNGMGINLEELRAAINCGLSGKIVDVTDEGQGQHVEIIIE